jgi:hypothetical protein
MTRLSKNEREKLVLERFLERVGLPHVSIDAEREEPDAVVQFEDGQEVAFELVEYHQADMRCFESGWSYLNNCIAERVKNHPRQDVLDHISGLVWFKANELPPKRQLPDLAVELVGVMNVHAESVTRNGKITLESFPGCSLANRYASKITLSDAKLAIVRWWSCANVQCGVVGLNKSELENVVRDKSARVQTYRANVPGSPLWLLVHAGDYSVSTFAPHVSQLRAYAASAQAFLEATGFDSIWFHPACGDASEETGDLVPLVPVRLL